jgi:hypothetical protein
MYMREFYYFDSNVIRLGDVVKGPRNQIGRVDEIIQPGSMESKAYSCPEGGVRFIFDWDGIQDAVMMLPPDRQYWEDIEFIRRA